MCLIRDNEAYSTQTDFRFKGLILNILILNLNFRVNQLISHVNILIFSLKDSENHQLN
ncbi:hypothetical protein MADA3029_900037 [Vibrio nigripulchritudo MADA3029]|nr:hypothetical protein VIBNIMADA3021_1160036 [Vibrio nigripulchritudo MADA3021]CCN61895.1 hypothetical protein MADA3029_900037 [Vibrio nigripulchritudo MADA3029]